MAALTIYLMYALALPAGAAQQIDKQLRSFFWKGSNEGKNLHAISWDRITAPKDAGGLGLRKTVILRKAIYGVLAAKVLSDSSLLNWVFLLSIIGLAIRGN
ncbi:hypothetical protein QJS10_CPB15g01453 [Acorus calamus]|uniref:Uncharacterized protein n=1 Tax=Acorus calamus TaxID=4465 RepID=A0AAV9D873_ACOCL|nr:hypothetical protein QJS10_CPB15g01453 [Acorus calamus]